MTNRPTSVLIADDNESTLDVLEIALRGAGYLTHRARSGGEALIQFTDGRDVDVVLADVVMPEISGLELAQRLKGMRPDVPVVLMTGHDAYADEVINAGAIPLLKPFRVATLIRVLQDCRDTGTLTGSANKRVRGKSAETRRGKPTTNASS